MAGKLVRLVIRREATEKGRRYISFETEYVLIGEILNAGLENYLDSKVDAYADEGGVSAMMIDYITTRGTDLVLYDRQNGRLDLSTKQYLENCQDELEHYNEYEQ